MLKKLSLTAFILFMSFYINASADKTNSKLSKKNRPKLTAEEVWEKELNDPRLEKAMLEKQQAELDADKKESHSIGHIILMYIPNRLIDLTDIFTIDFGFGPEASLVLTLTKWAEFGGAYGDRYFVTKGYNRQYGGGYHGGYLGSLLCYDKEEAFTDYTFGYVEPYAFDQPDFSVAKPNETIYNKGIRDFWRIGVHAGWLIDFGFAFHPVALTNFFTGFVFVRLTDTEDL